MYEELEDRLDEWIRISRERGLCVSGKSIQKEAKRLYGVIECEKEAAEQQLERDESVNVVRNESGHQRGNDFAQAVAHHQASSVVHEEAGASVDQIQSPDHSDKFEASSGWLVNFLNRKNYAMRRTTTRG